jgi:3-oxoacyl-[acyl-carrier-protein] synthase II
MTRRRVAITGLGVVTPLGVGIAATWEGLVCGRSGAGHLKRFDSEGFGVHIAAEADDFEPTDFMDPRDVRRSDRFCQMAVAAAALAVNNAQWSELPFDRDRIGVVVGSGIGGLSTLEAQHDVLRDRGPSKVSPFCVPLLMINGAAGAIAMRLGVSGPNFSPVSACASGAHAIGEGARLISAGDADAVLAGGAESAITPLALAAFATMGALSRRNDDPARASRPFDADRDGFVMGEGAGVLVLEDWQAAQSRGADILGELAGYGASSDAFHLTQPDPDGAGATKAMRLALRDAGVDPGDIGYINAHGTSTPFNDRVETQAIRRVFDGNVPPVSSTKSATGHLLGAAGAVEAAATVMALKTGTLPPTINYDTPDPDCDLDYVPNSARQSDARVGLSNSFGFGGHNACLVFRSAS